MIATIHKKPKWSFYATWIILSLLSVPIALFLSLAVMGIVTDLVGDYVYVNGVRHITEDFLLLYAFVPIGGLVMGLLQYGFLRRYLPHMGWWVLATTGGWLLGALLIGIPGWLHWTDAFEKNLDLILIVMGFSIGLGQWLLLRRHLARAGWWIAANVLGWGLLALVTVENTVGQFGIFTLGFIPACVTAAVLGLLINQAPRSQSQGL